ncbi:MAG: hypothetical protein JWN71_5094 [Xanthobacteraceae bacterium]|nr:hypothetical protein [Xanthobacteraceae bacterium]
MRHWPIVALCLALLAVPALAQDGPRLSLAAAEAGKTLTLRLSELATAKAPLEIAKPPVAEPFGRIFNAKALLALPPVTAKDVPWLLEWLTATSSAYQQLLLFGSEPGAPQESVVAANLQRNEKEISVAMEFLLFIMPRTTGAASAFFETLPESERNSTVRQNGLARMRAGYMQTVSGAVTFIGGGPKPENARLVAAALRTTLGDWIQLSNAENRTELLTLLAQARNGNKDEKVQADLLAVSSALAAMK